MNSQLNVSFYILTNDRERLKWNEEGVKYKNKTPVAVRWTAILKVKLGGLLC